MYYLIPFLVDHVGDDSVDEWEGRKGGLGTSADHSPCLLLLQALGGPV